MCKEHRTKPKHDHKPTHTGIDRNGRSYIKLVKITLCETDKNYVRVKTTIILFCINIAIANNALGQTYFQGAAAAVTRSVTSKLQEQVSVLDFGADPTGITDSTANIQNALNSVPNGSVLFPSQVNGLQANYKVSTLYATRSQRLIGGEASSSQIQCTMQPGICIVFGDNNNGVTYAHGGMSNITLLGPSTYGSGTGLYLGGDPAGVISPATNYGDFLSFENVRIKDFGTGIVFGNNAYEISFHDALIVHNAKGIVYPSNLANSGELLTFFGGSVSANTVSGIENDGGGEFSLHGVGLDYNPVAITGNSVWLYAFGCHFEQTDGPLLNIGGGTRLILTGNTYLLNSPSGSDVSMINISNSDVNVSVSGGDAWTNHPVAYFLNAPNAPTYNLRIGGGLNVAPSRYVAAVSNPPSGVGIVIDLAGTTTVGNLVVTGACTGCAPVAPPNPTPVITSFNGRTGAVAPSYDYTLDKILAPVASVNLPLGNNSVTIGATTFTSSSFLVWNTGSTINSPNVMGFTPGSGSGQASRIQVGDGANTIQSAAGYRTQMSSYWPLELRGNRQAGAPPFAAGSLSDASVVIYGPQPGGNVLELYETTGTNKVLSVDSYGNTQAGSLTLHAFGQQPACSSPYRGMMWFANGGSGADHLYSCASTGSGFSWKTIY